jgi:hypothetical protein
MRRSIPAPRGGLSKKRQRTPITSGRWESRALQLQERDAWLHRLLPFGLVLAFLIASVVIAFASPAAGAAALIFTMAGVLTAYLTGRAPNIRSDATAPTPPHRRPEPREQPPRSFRTFRTFYDRLRAAKRSLVIGKSLQGQLHPEGGVGLADAARA